MADVQPEVDQPVVRWAVLRRLLRQLRRNAATLSPDQTQQRVSWRSPGSGRSRRGPRRSRGT
jgi:hypothetical protein